jgi:hypothetical protein
MRSTGTLPLCLKGKGREIVRCARLFECMLAAAARFHEYARKRARVRLGDLGGLSL